MSLLLIDIDGTLADNKKRKSKSLKSDGTIDWERFLDPNLIIDDEIVIGAMELAELVGDLSTETESKILGVYYLTGREGTPEVIQATCFWLAYNSFLFAPVIFRQIGDRRSDAWVKQDLILENWLKRKIHPPYFALDDCGASYQDPQPMLQMYQELDFRVIDPKTILEKRKNQ